MIVSFISNAQQTDLVNTLRIDFQKIENEDDIERILAYDAEGLDKDQLEIINSYQAAGTCMMANYVFSPKSKLNYFKQGKGELEELILTNKDVEKVYLRLLIQLNIPKFLNYHKEIEGDLVYLQENMAKAPLEVSFKKQMIENLMSVTKNKDFREALLDIKVEEKC